MNRKKQWSLILRGDTETVEIVLKDQDGPRASKRCVNGLEVDELFAGWEQSYGCEISLLLAPALRAASAEIAAVVKNWLTTVPRYSGLRTLSPKAAMRAMQLGRSSYRPQEIRELKNQIEAETQAAEFKAQKTGFCDQEDINRIVGMKVELDGLYAAWAESA